MRRLAIRLGVLLLGLLIVTQFALPPYLEHRVENRLTEHGGNAKVDLRAIPAARLLFKHGRELDIHAQGLSVDLEDAQKDVFEQLDGFQDVTIAISGSRAGPFTIRSFRVMRRDDGTYAVVIAGDGAAGDVARYAGSRLAGGLGQALAGLAAGAFGDAGRPIPFDAAMQIDTSGGDVQATNVEGQVAGFPAGPLAQVVANALLSAL